MNLSFYVASTGAKTHQKHLDILGNNIANVNTSGYKTSIAGFSDLLYQNIGELNPQDLTYGSGARVEKTDTLFSQAGFNTTGGTYDFAIDGSGFFALSNPGTGEISYTRAGAFRESSFNGNYYLTDQSGKFVLNKQGTPIRTDLNQDVKSQIGVYEFETNEGLMRQGENAFTPVLKNGEATVSQTAKVLDGMLELSNVDLGVSMTKIIEAQRAYQFNIRMIQTTDETMQTVNSLRR